MVLEQNKNLQVSAVIPETEITRIKLKSLASVSIKSIEKTFTGTVTEISPSAIATGGQYIVKISLPKEAQNGLNAGMYANVQIAVEGILTKTKNDAVLVPLGAINNIGQLTALYTMSNSGTALLRYVRLGKTSGNNVEILSGLNNNESFIASADGKLYNGVPVRVK